MKIFTNHHNKLTEPFEKSLPFIVILFLFMLSAATDAADIRQLSYRYRYEVAKDAGESAFVVCDDCKERRTLPVHSRRHIVSGLAVRASDDLPGQKAHPREAVDTNMPAHALSCLYTTVYFGFDQHEIPPEGRDALLRMATLLSGNPKVQVRVQGYTCEIGSEEYNQQLSAKRAEVVSSFLREHGVHVAQSVGKGACCRVSDKDRALNRRAEVSLQVIPQQQP